MGSLITTAVKYCTGNETIYTGDIVILMGIENQLNISTETSDDETTLSEEDILVINSKSKFSIKASRALYAEFTISLRKFKELFPNKKYRFLCDSTKVKMIILQYCEDI